MGVACFRYNKLVGDATVMAPYKAVFGVEAFSFDAETGRRMVIDREPDEKEGLADKLHNLHQSTYLVKSIGCNVFCRAV